MVISRVLTDFSLLHFSVQIRNHNKMADNHNMVTPFLQSPTLINAMMEAIQEF